MALATAVAAAMGIVFVTGGAAGAASSVEAPASSAAQSAKKAVATLTIIEPSASVRRKGKDEFKPATDGQNLRVGDTVQTDAAGFVQINYTDDSFTRLDVDTEFTILSLTDDEGNRKIKGSLESGQTWNRTSALTESESFEQEGAGATAAVVGTAFVLSCTSPGNCTLTSVVHGTQWTTVDGELQLVGPLEECVATEVVDETDLCDEATQLTLDAILANDWLMKNLFLDGLLGLEGIIIVEDGQVVSFTPTPTPTPVHNETQNPSATAPPVIDPDNPIACDFSCHTTHIVSTALPPDFEPGSSIHLHESDPTIDFVANYSNPSGLTAYVVFTKLPTLVGTVYISDSCAESVGSEVCIPTMVAPDQRYPGATVFSFDALEVGGDTMIFRVETDEASSQPASVDVVFHEDPLPPV